ncbi:helix-turn-helix domain-containing protein [Winogradskyella sp. PC D3.3]
MTDSYIKNHTITELIKILGDPDQRDGLHVHISRNNFEEIPISYPFRGDSYFIILLISGTITIQLNLISQTLSKNDVIIVKPQTVTHILKMSPELTMVAISFNVDFILKNGFKKEDFDAFDFFTASNVPKLKLSDQEAKSIIETSKILEKHNRFTITEIPYREEVILASFRLILYQYASFYKKAYPNLEAKLSRQEDLTLRFLNILNENLKHERSVEFYADILCITSGHLSKILKETTGKTANQLIDEAVILEAKILLNTPALSIAQIAQELRFSDQSFFGKFFKRHTGSSPSAFRKAL